MAITQEKNVKSVAFQTSEAADLQPAQSPRDTGDTGNRTIMRESDGGVGSVFTILFHTRVFRALYLPTPFPRGRGEFSPADLANQH